MTKDKNTKQRTIYGLYIFVIISLFLYSFTQIDLSLTFSRITFLRNIVKSFQYIGYFNRPMSTYIYTGILILLYGFYSYFLKLSLQKKIARTTFWKLIILVIVILVFSYNAFSYDIFNYIFDAKIYSHYHLNPYLHKALDFPHDPMLSFMRWTHRVYPYGPVWLLLTIPLSYLGHNLFLPTFFLFKLLCGLSFIGSTYLIGKICRNIKPDNETFAIAFFAFNPLVLIESLVSGHLDIVMIFFALFATYQLISKKYALAFLLLLMSIGVKVSTIFLLPVFLYVYILHLQTKNLPWDTIFKTCVLFTAMTVIVASKYSGNFQPWYILLPVSYGALIAKKYYVALSSIIISFFALFTYVPYLYLGNWNPPVPQVLSTIYMISIVLSVVAVLYQTIKHPSFAS